MSVTDASIPEAEKDTYMMCIHVFLKKIISFVYWLVDAFGCYWFPW